MTAASSATCGGCFTGLGDVTRVVRHRDCGLVITDPTKVREAMDADGGGVRCDGCATYAANQLKFTKRKVSFASAKRLSDPTSRLDVHRLGVAADPKVLAARYRAVVNQRRERAKIVVEKVTFENGDEASLLEIFDEAGKVLSESRRKLPGAAALYHKVMNLF